MAISVALGYDPLYGLIAVIGGMSTGYAPAAINPYTVAIAQSIAELPLFSGSGFRIVCYIVFLTVFLIQMCRYGRMVKADPKKSYVYGVKFPFITTIFLNSNSRSATKSRWPSAPSRSSSSRGAQSRAAGTSPSSPRYSSS